MERMMDLSLEQVRALDPELARQLIPQWLSGFVRNAPGAAAEVLQDTSEILAGVDDQSIVEAIGALVGLGDEYRLYDAHPVAQAMTRAFLDPLGAGSELEGVEHLRAAMQTGPCLLLSNHLAYADTLAKDWLLARNGAADIAGKLVAVAGPKVYGTAFRRMASLGLSTLKTAQSSAVAHNEAGLTPREVGRIAIQTVQAARLLMSDDRPVLVYAEGSRSRDGRLRPFLKAVRKYAMGEGVQVVPLAISGSDALMPLHQPYIFRHPVRVRIGPGICADDLGAPAAIAACWSAIADLLDPAHRPDAGTPALI
jgi:1-acyl-sn-glycerol-3-phosphate acyltransferase